jgi:hypothetical protein
MAGSLTDYGENKVVDHITGKATWAAHTAYIGLLLADPGEGNSGAGWSEVANTNGYARKATAAGDWNVASGGAADNANPITFNSASGGSWGEVTHFGIFDSPVWGEGKLIGYGDLTTPKTIDDGDTPQFAAGELDITAT